MASQQPENECAFIDLRLAKANAINKMMEFVLSQLLADPGSPEEPQEEHQFPYVITIPEFTLGSILARRLGVDMCEFNRARRDANSTFSRILGGVATLYSVSESELLRKHYLPMSEILVSALKKIENENLRKFCPNDFVRRGAAYWAICSNKKCQERVFSIYVNTKTFRGKIVKSINSLGRPAQYTFDPYLDFVTVRPFYNSLEDFGCVRTHATPVQKRARLTPPNAPIPSSKVHLPHQECELQRERLFVNLRSARRRRRLQMSDSNSETESEEEGLHSSSDGGVECIFDETSSYEASSSSQSKGGPIERTGTFLACPFLDEESRPAQDPSPPESVLVVFDTDDDDFSSLLDKQDCVEVVSESTRKRKASDTSAPSTPVESEAPPRRKLVRRKAKIDLETNLFSGEIEDIRMISVVLASEKDPFNKLMVACAPSWDSTKTVALHCVCADRSLKKVIAVKAEIQKKMEEK